MSTLFTETPFDMEMFKDASAVLSLVVAMYLLKQLLAAGACIGVVSEHACNWSDWALQGPYLELRSLAELRTSLATVCFLNHSFLSRGWF